jgi:hypothetical protein
MPPTVATSGSAALTVGGAEVNAPAAVTTSGTYIVRFDFSTMAKGDIIEVRIYLKRALAGDAEVLYWGPHSVSNDQAEEILDSIPIISPASIRATLKQTAGTARTIPFALIAP